MKTSPDPHDDIIPSAIRRRPPPSARRATTTKSKPLARKLPATKAPAPAVRAQPTVNRQPLTVKSAPAPKPSARGSASAPAEGSRQSWTSTHKLVGIYLSEELRVLIDGEVAKSDGALSKSKIVEMEVRKRYGLPPPPPGPRTR